MDRFPPDIAVRPTASLTNEIRQPLREVDRVAFDTNRNSSLGLFMGTHFSDHFGVDAQDLMDYGAFDISVASDLPLFVDPFLIFNSSDPHYQALHEDILRYLVYLRDRAQSIDDPDTVANLYQFKEVKQNWLGFTVLGNQGRGLGPSFARALHSALKGPVSGFGTETITRSSHLEKLTLIKGGVGRDAISDFTTNLIKGFLCEFTQTFALAHLASDQVRDFAVSRAAFNYSTHAWETRRYTLPKLGRDFVLLTPFDLLTREETWINHPDMLDRFPSVVEAVRDAQLRAQINHYFRQHLSRNPTKPERNSAARKVFDRYPDLIDRYIRLREESGDAAAHVSKKRVSDTRKVFVEQLRDLIDALAETTFFDTPLSSYEEALARVRYFKHYVEEKGGFRLINRGGKPFSSEREVQIFFGLAFYSTEFDLSREPETGRGPVDFKVSKGVDKSLIEFKLGSNSHLKRNLEKQVAIYAKAEQAKRSVTVIVCYTKQQTSRVDTTLRELDLKDDESIVVIDARDDNKPSASKA